MSKNAHFCSCCGNAMGLISDWPAPCQSCGRKTYRNPIPVAVALVPVLDPPGLLTIRRGIEPGVGKLALPGGYVDWHDLSWQHAAAREVFEETGLKISETDFRAFDVVSSSDKKVLVFAISKPVSISLPQFVPTAETTELVIIGEPTELAFPLHTQAVAQYFQSGGRTNVFAANPLA